MRNYRRPSRCPSCGGLSIASILYGLPAFDTELQRDLDSERVVLEGCVVSDAMPEWRCVGCHHEWGSRKLEGPQQALTGVEAPATT